MKHTEYITFNGHSENIKSLLPAIRILKNEGWQVTRPRIYPDTEDKKRDYVTILVHREFNL